MTQTTAQPAAGPDASTPPDPFDVVVVGGGPAGVTAALRARELGAQRVALVEAGPLGGTCANGGCVPVRALAKAARLLRDAGQFAEFGLPAATPASPPAAAFPAVMDRVHAIVARVHEKKNLAHTLQLSGVQVFAGLGDARLIDAARGIRLGDGRVLCSHKLILCAGGRPRRLDIPGGHLASIIHDVWNLRALPRRLVVIGAAATGCQLASIFRTFGSEVCLLEMADRLLPGSDADVSAAIAAAFARAGIRVVTSVKAVTRIDEAADGTRRLTCRVPVEGHDPEATRELHIDADVVLASIGWPGNADRLGAADAGLEVERAGYVKVNEYQQTNLPHVFAAGDSDGRMMLVQTAGYEGPLAAENAVLGLRRRCEHLVVPHGGFTDPEYGSVGLSEHEARRKLGDDAVAIAVAPYTDLDRAVIDGRTEGFCKLLADRSTRQIIGAHVVGEDATEIVQIAAAAMTGGMPIERLADLQLSYPTFTGVIGLAARELARDLGAVALAGPWSEMDLPRPADWERRG
jgi:pyruvate/2-oxoglutarate dehydrogenase complex dihydrolipoamide dehydrogenase (E3) component